jgi:hypothetical protein
MLISFSQLAYLSKLGLNKDASMAAWRWEKKPQYLIYAFDELKIQLLVSFEVNGIRAMYCCLCYYINLIFPNQQN